MATSDNRIPANQVVWLLAGLVVIWAVWLFLPKSEKPSAVRPPVMGESKLRAVGLPNNPDWEGLPELFAVWSSQAPWKDGKVEFAYWNNGARAYSDFFEARQENGKIRFRVMSRKDALHGKEFIGNGSGEFFLSESDLPAAVDFGTDSPTHPFVFFKTIKAPPFPPSTVMQPRPISDPGPRPPPAKLPPFPVPPITIPPPLLPNEPVKK